PMKLVKTICATVLLCTSSQLFGAVFYWTNSGEGQFTTPSNWNSNSVPTSADDARVNNGGTAVIDSTMTQALSLLQIGDTNTTTGTVRMTGGSLTLASDLRAGGNSATAGGVGVFELQGGTVVVTGGNLNLGFGTNNANGTYNISGGSIQCNAANPIFAIGNRGTGTVNQSGGSIYLRNATGVTQLGRNIAAGTGFGSYTMTGGTLACAKLQFGNAIGTGPQSTNSFTLYSGTVMVNTVSNVNTTALNTFTFGGFFSGQQGGTLMMQTCSISLAHRAGLLIPAAIDFTSSAATNIASLPVNLITKLSFLANSSYSEGTGGVIGITISGPSSYSSIDIGAGGTATLAGAISITLANGYVPALGTTFDILTAPTINGTGTVQTSDGSTYSTSIVTGGDGRQVLRLTLTAQPVSAPQLNITSPSNGTVQLTFSNSAGHTFEILGTSNITNIFNSIGTATEVSPGQYQFNDTTGSLKFYRVLFP
ncbi:MAG: outer rane autotransporter barrel protein, partial [Verrucomicrobiales bacterium]|nr:outer rane autotransporter barrel protein [Verrucomicrobiales bacterium]